MIITGRRQAELDKAVDAIGLRADSTDLPGLDQLYDDIRARFGRLDVVFANAGGGSMLPLGQITEEQFDDTFAKAAVFLASDDASFVNGAELFVDGGQAQV